MMRVGFVDLCLNKRCVLLTFAGVPFPRNFNSVAKNILKRLFRVYAHIYHSHYNKVP